MSADLIQELRDGLEGTTKGTWRPGHLANDDHSCDCGFVFDSLDRQGSIATVNMDDGGQFGKEYPSRDEAKANLNHIIAAQPDNIRALLDALTTKDTALAEARAEHSASRRNFHTMQHAANALLKRATTAEASLADLAAENERLKLELAEFDETNRMMVKHADIRRAELERLKKALILAPMAARVTELPHFMAAMAEWGCTDPNEQAASITDFLNSLVGLREYLDSSAALGIQDGAGK